MDYKTDYKNFIESELKKARKELREIKAIHSKMNKENIGSDAEFCYISYQLDDKKDYVKQLEKVYKTLKEN